MQHFFALLLYGLLVSGHAVAEQPAKQEIATPAVSEASQNEIIKSENDNRTYRYLVLPNQLRVLLISDPLTEKSAAALDVNIGSADDPEDRAGLAHFLEHMLFLGTKKYPKAGEYQEYINSHSGTHNAFTSLEHTNYHFDINPNYLEPALDRFAQFFISPLLDKTYVTRERKAVHSEYSARYKDEYRRSWDVLSEITHPDSKSARFSVGTEETLADKPGKPIRNDLLKFHQAHYSANLMTLVVIGKETPDQLAKMVTSRFSAIPDKKIKQEKIEKPLFPADLLPAKVFVQPLQEQRIISLTFPVPAFEQFYQEKPVHYLGYLLGHEGNGSLYQVLRERGWVESLSAGASISNRESAAFTISITLTKDGYQQREQIIDMVFQAIDRVKNDGVEKWRFTEQGVISDTTFRYQEKGDAQDYASVLANNLHYYAPKHVINGMTMMEKYDEKMILRYLDYLKPENALITINAPDVLTDKTSKYYQTRYSVSKAIDDEVQRWKNSVKGENPIQLPQPNEFVAKQLKIKNTDLGRTAAAHNTVPALIRNEPNLRLWFKQDDRFNVPRGGIYIYARSANSVQSARSAALTELFAGLLKNNLNSHAYTASLAGLELQLHRRQRGLGIEISGYNDKQGLLLTRALDAIASPTFKQEDFDNVKESLLRELKNFDKKAPYQQAGRNVLTLISKGDYTPAQLSEAIKKIQLKAVQEFSLNWLNGINADVLIHGNYTEADALKLTSIIENKLSLKGPRHLDPAGIYIKLPPTKKGVLHHIAVDHSDVAAMHYIQGANTTAHEQARLQLQAQLMSSEFFHQLRTEQQLGYIVYGGYSPVAHVPGIAFVVQSPTHTPEQIDASINIFLTEFAKELETMPATDFEQHRRALLLNLEESPKNLAEESAEYWTQIAYRQLSFDFKQQLIREVKAITQKNMTDYYWKTFLSPNVKKLVVVATAKDRALSASLTEQYQPLGDQEKFKKEAKYFILK